MADPTIRANERITEPLAVVVGAGGMAMAVARRLGVSHRLLVADRRDLHLQAQVSTLRQEGYDASGVVCDITDPLAVEGLAEAAREAGTFKALAHVVGLSPSMAEAATILQVDLMGAALVAAAFEPLAQPGAAAVFIASLAAHVRPWPEALLQAVDDPLSPDLVGRVQEAAGDGFDTGLAYSAAKHGLIRMCRRQAPTWGRRGARIMSVSPGLIASPQGAREFEAQASKQRLLQMTPLRRQGTMVEIAQAVDFLLSDQASFISGIDLLVDGGLVAALQHPPGPTEPG